jgi:hypothetical protein
VCVYVCIYVCMCIGLFSAGAELHENTMRLQAELNLCAFNFFCKKIHADYKQISIFVRSNLFFVKEYMLTTSRSQSLCVQVFL